MNKKEWNEGLNLLEAEIIEKHIEQKERLVKKKNSQKIFIRFGAIAACFAIVIGAVIAVPRFFLDDDVEPYIPDGKPWSPIIGEGAEEIVLNADSVANAFDMKYDGATNQYTKVYSTSPEYLYISPIPDSEYLPIYSQNKAPTAKKSNLETFINKYYDAATELFDVKSNGYEIEKDESYDGSIYYTADIMDSRYIRETSTGYKHSDKWIRFSSNSIWSYFSYYAYHEDRMTLNGEIISVTEQDTDEQIIEKTKTARSYVCNLLGKEYTEVKVCRKYSYDQLQRITIYLYPSEKTIFPPDFRDPPMTSEYIELEFCTDWGDGSANHWGGSKDEAFLTDVSFYELLKNPNESYDIEGKAKMISLEEAEKLLDKGYVFGGHSCKLCMAEQPEVDFSDYECVDIEYVRGVESNIHIPFYAFYKYIGETSYGMPTYAKTYVPAVKVDGLDKYFKEQIKNRIADIFE